VAAKGRSIRWVAEKPVRRGDADRSILRKRMVPLERAVKKKTGKMEILLTVKRLHQHIGSGISMVYGWLANSGNYAN